jgi:hypothetical protein
LNKLLVSVASLAALAMPAFPQGGIGGRARDVPASEVAKAGPAPRLPDGHPDLGNGKGVWNPRTVTNLSGTSPQGAGRAPTEKKIEIPMQPWAKALYEARVATAYKEDPEGRCLPPGIPRMYATPFPFQIFQMADRVLFIFEGATHIWREVFTDGRPHPADVNPSFLGDAIGHWDGDTLVVDTVGFNEESWLDQDGHPHTEALHTIEKFTRTNALMMRYEVTIDDPNAYTNSWTSSFLIPWAPSTELMEYICQENNRDVFHLVGK